MSNLLSTYDNFEGTVWTEHWDCPILWIQVVFTVSSFVGNPVYKYRKLLNRKTTLKQYLIVFDVGTTKKQIVLLLTFKKKEMVCVHCTITEKNGSMHKRGKNSGWNNIYSIPSLSIVNYFWQNTLYFLYNPIFL